MSSVKLNYRLVNLLLFMIIIFIVVFTANYWSSILNRLFGIVLPFLIAFILAYVLHPFVKRLERMGLPRMISLFLVLFVIILAIVGLFMITVPVIYEQLVSFTKTIGEVIRNIDGKFDIDLGQFETTVLATLNQWIQRIGVYISTGTIQFLGKSVHFFTDFMITVMVFIYFLIDMDKIRLGVKNFFYKNSQKWYLYLKQLDTEIGNYFHGLFLFMIVQFFEYSILFWLIGHPNWLLLGILACVTTVIPYFGGLITNLIALLIASAVSSSLFLGTLVITIVFSNVDGYLISPAIYGKTNQVNPILSIFSVGFFSNFFGIMGVMMGLPFYIVLRSTWNFFYQDIKSRVLNNYIF